jgi:hypothetical protein
MSEERSQYEAQMSAKVVISGTLVYHDKDGQEVGRADFTMPVDEHITITEQDNGKHRQ